MYPIVFVIYFNWTDINDCADDPCTNSGTCIDHVNNFTCACVDGFTGNRCETGRLDFYIICIHVQWHNYVHDIYYITKSY
jgi:hypothetical protein